MKRRKKKGSHGADEARALDRAFFAANPDALSYVRPLLAGEYAPRPDLAGVPVVVARVGPGFYLKSLLSAGDTEEGLRRWLEGEALKHRQEEQANRAERRAVGPRVKA